MCLREVFGTIPLQLPPVQCCSYAKKWSTVLYKGWVNLQFSCPISTGECQEDSSEEIYAGLQPLKWPRETFDKMVRNFKFPNSWDARYPDEGQTVVDAPAG
ncbi:hypothetical protein Hanom_Chr11g01015531 [Helianthus anomalus]